MRFSYCMSWGLFLLLGSLPLRANYEMVDQVVAVVEDDVVLASEIREQIVQLIDTLNRRGIAVPSKEVLFEQVMEQSILERLQLQRATRMGLRVSDQRLNDAMTEIASNNGLSLSDFRRVLIDNGESYVDLREKIRRDILIREVQQRNVIRSINVNKSEVDSFLSSDRGQALIQPEWQVDHLLMPVESFDDERAVEVQRSKIDALRGLAQAGGNFQSILPSVRESGASYQPLGWLDVTAIPSLFAELVPELSQGEISSVIQSDSGFHLVQVRNIKGGAVGTVSETKVRHILVGETTVRDYDQSKVLIETVKGRLANGESFSLLAREFSDDPGSALSGGDLGWVELGTMVPEFEQRMVAAPVNEVSEVFRSQFGWHILEVLERRERDAFEERSRQIARQKIAESKYDDALNNWLQELRDNSYVEIK